MTEQKHSPWTKIAQHAEWLREGLIMLENGSPEWCQARLNAVADILDDNQATIRRLEAENAELRETVADLINPENGSDEYKFALIRARTALQQDTKGESNG